MPAPGTPALADAFLALADDGDPPSQRSLTRALTAAIAAVALACAAPLAWGAHPRAAKPAAPPAALGAKHYGVEDE